ncbi:hypothetical protein SAMN04488059_10429 [Devosia psychrophila]|jgi:hypothetical protein|uniref:Uncharacterized protein n=1 Tax=Devosia psychrophila TaxID=728005 RepID=A0A1I1IBF6_9HYPH|nr:hypothetical protein SAMN04488059_10429 [Devosia psychrophila]
MRSRPIFRSVDPLSERGNIFLVARFVAAITVQPERPVNKLIQVIY